MGTVVAPKGKQRGAQLAQTAECVVHAVHVIITKVQMPATQRSRTDHLAHLLLLADLAHVLVATAAMQTEDLLVAKTVIRMATAERAILIINYHLESVWFGNVMDKVAGPAISVPAVCVAEATAAMQTEDLLVAKTVIRMATAERATLVII